MSYSACINCASDASTHPRELDNIVNFFIFWSSGLSLLTWFIVPPPECGGLPAQWTWFQQVYIIVSETMYIAIIKFLLKDSYLTCPLESTMMHRSLSSSYHRRRSPNRVLRETVSTFAEFLMDNWSGLSVIWYYLLLDGFCKVVPEISRDLYFDGYVCRYSGPSLTLPLATVNISSGHPRVWMLSTSHIYRSRS